jgi:hypothetical protein
MNHLPAVVDITREYSLSELKAQYIVDGFLDVFNPEELPKWQDAANQIVVTDESQTAEMERARQLRLEIRKTRLAVEAKRKDLKDSALREGKAIDTIGRVVRESIEALEERLKEQEEYAKRQEEKRERERRERAEALLREQEERERKEAEEKRLAEQRAMREENERLKAEAAEREKLLAEERAKQQAEHDRAIRQQEAERQAERERHAAELAAERERVAQLAAMVVCPNCGHAFDSREHRQGAT